MKNVAALLIVLVGSVIGRSDAVSCYDCVYDIRYPKNATCTEPFNATTAPSCKGTGCFLWAFAKIEVSPKPYKVSRGCVNLTISQEDLCQGYYGLYEQYIVTTFTYDRRCCLQYGAFTQDGSWATITGCFCQEDNCNGDLPYDLSNVGFSVEPASQLAIVAIITVLPKIISVI